MAERVQKGDDEKAGKRVQAVVGFDTQLKEVTAKVKDYCSLMKDFPLQDLLAANTLDIIRAAISAIFQHMQRIRNTSYPLDRTMQLLEAVSREVVAQITKVLGTQRLLLVTFEEFQKAGATLEQQGVRLCINSQPAKSVMSHTNEVFIAWEEGYNRLWGQLRDIAKRKKDEVIKMGYRLGAYLTLRERMNTLKEFRRQHEKLHSAVTRVMSSGRAGAGIGGIHLQREIVEAFDNVKVLDCLDLTPEGMTALDVAMKRYAERIDVVEARITALLREQLGTTKNANVMFKIFSRYNALFVRPHIQEAIREYQTQLIQKVKEDIDGLHQKFKPSGVQGKIFCVNVKKTRAGEVRVLQVNFQSDIIQLPKEERADDAILCSKEIDRSVAKARSASPQPPDPSDATALPTKQLTIGSPADTKEHMRQGWRREMMQQGYSDEVVQRALTVAGEDLELGERILKAFGTGGFP